MKLSQKKKEVKPEIPKIRYIITPKEPFGSGYISYVLEKEIINKYTFKERIKVKMHGIYTTVLMDDDSEVSFWDRPDSNKAVIEIKKPKDQRLISLIKNTIKYNTKVEGFNEES